MKKAIAALSCTLFAWAPPQLMADRGSGEQTDGDERLEIVIVTGVRMRDALLLKTSQVVPTGPDASDLLRLLPGANRNANGPLSRISQYRGMQGAQNSISIDGASYTAGGPNWMDTPLSSIPRALTESVTLVRGLGSVDTIAEGLGGSISIASRRGEFSGDGVWSAYGQGETGYGDNASGWNAALFAGIHNQRNRLDFAASVDEGDDYSFGGGTVAASRFDRRQYRFGYGHRFDAAEFSLAATVNRTGESGTPALPMDIRFVDSQQYAFDWSGDAGAGRLTLQVSMLSVTHLMDNFTLRLPPLNPMGMPNFRKSNADGDSGTAKLAWEWQGADLNILAGFDGHWEAHTAQIEDPTRERFRVSNFNQVQRDRAGAFATVITRAAEWDLEAGLRYNTVSMSAGEVGGNLALMPGSPMSVQQERLDELAASFNAADRKRRDDHRVAILKASRDFGDGLRLNLGLGRKMRSPSYQERYLWLPLEATAGLADGRTYIGDMGLEPEKSIEITAGIDWRAGRLKLSPELFYRDVRNFIQGLPSTNETANRFAMMMGGKPPLQFANVDAELYGADLGYEWQIADAWLLSGNLSYVRGRRDGSGERPGDHLYRIAPLSSFLELRYTQKRFHFSVQSVAAARQDRVAAYNDEQETPGWGIVHLRGGWQMNEQLSLAAGVENLADKVYQDHLGGYNRVRGSDVPLGARLYSAGRNFYLRLNASW